MLVISAWGTPIQKQKGYIQETGTKEDATVWICLAGNYYPTTANPKLQLINLSYRAPNRILYIYIHE